MDKLEFTQEEKDWAALLYSVMAEDQKIAPGDTGDTGLYGTNYGEVTFYKRTKHFFTPFLRQNSTTPAGRGQAKKRKE